MVAGTMKGGKPIFDQKKEVRAIARERVGVVKASQVIQPKKSRKKLKHKKPPGEAEAEPWGA